MLEECSLEGPPGILLSDLYRLLEVKSGAQIDSRLQVISHHGVSLFAIIRPESCLTINSPVDAGCIMEAPEASQRNSIPTKG